MELKSFIVHCTSTPTSTFEARAAKLAASQIFGQVATGEDSFFTHWRPKLAAVSAADNTAALNREPFVYNVEDPSTVAYLEWIETRASLSGKRIKLATGDFHGQFGFELSRDEVDSNLVRIEQILSKTIRIIEVCEVFADWISLVTAGIVPVFFSSEKSASGGSSLFPGVYFLEFGVPAHVVAESMVHESAHQWYFVGERAVELVNGLDRQTYYSPFKRKFRDIRTILQTYHSFANVSIFYFRLVRTGFALSSVERENIGRVFQWTIDLEAHLEASCGLTVAGREFFDAIKSELSKESYTSKTRGWP